MPKEGVFGRQYAHEPASTSGDDPPEKPQVPVVDVLWMRDDGYVQIVSKVEDAHGGRWADGHPTTHFTDGMYVDLDRAAVNKLIRNLRRARDQAFGRDE